jgi:acyl carrier protein
MNKSILEVIKRTFELENVDTTVSQKNCVKWDSLNHLNLIIELESEFNLSFEPEEIAEMKSYEDIERIISAKV